MKRKLIFRTDASQTMGRGHLSRCLAVAGMVKEQLDVSFAFSKENESFLRGLNLEFNTNFFQDTHAFIDQLSEEDLVWLDGYHFDEAFKKEVRAAVFKLIETNDIPYAVKNVDVVFNHTPGLPSKDFEGDDQDHQLYLGLRYALLRKEFLEKATGVTPSYEGRGVFICFGGADTFDLGKKYVNALLNNGFKDPIYWVAKKGAEVSFPTNETAQVELLYQLDVHQMIDYMSKSRVLLVPSSVLSLEAVSLTKPMYTCYFVDNQSLIYRGLTTTGMAQGGGFITTEEQVLETTVDFLTFYKDPERHQKQRSIQESQIDGESGKRIREILLSL